MNNQPKFKMEFVQYIPDDFFNKKKNEPFIKNIMQNVLEKENWIEGNPNKFEPDYFCDDIPFEFTLASDGKGKFIRDFKNLPYSVKRVEDILKNYIRTALQKKSVKKYSVSDVNVCVLSLLRLPTWSPKVEQSFLKDIFYYDRNQFLEEIRNKYIENRVFNNIFIIFPDDKANWIVYDLLNRECHCLFLKNPDGTIPFIITKEIFDEFILEERKDNDKQ